MKIAIMICRILLGLVFFVFGLNQFFHFIPMQAPSGDAGIFLTGMIKSVYLIPVMGFFQTTCGLALLINRFVPLALIALFPIILNILLFHVYVAPEGLGMAIALILINVFLMYAYRKHYLHFTDAKASHH